MYQENASHVNKPRKFIAYSLKCSSEFTFLHTSFVISRKSWSTRESIIIIMTSQRMDPMIEVELRKDFLEKVDDMSHEDLKRIVKACVWNLQEATELVKCEEETSVGGHIDEESLRDVIQGLLAQLQQYRSEHLGYTDAMIKLQKQNHECIKRLHAASNLCWEPDALHKKAGLDHDVVLYYKTLTETLMKTVHELQESLKARTLQWQVTLNLYLKEKYEGGHNLTTLESIAKDKYTQIHRERQTKRERGGREWKEEHDLSGLRYLD